MQETWNSVTMLNGSDRPMQLLGTGGLAERVDQHAQLVDVLDARSDHQHLGRQRGRGAAGNPWRFDVKHIFPATDVDIESIRGRRR